MARTPFITAWAVRDLPVCRAAICAAISIFFQADKSVDYETLMSVMDELRTAGYLKIGLMGMETVKK